MLPETIGLIAFLRPAFVDYRMYRVLIGVFWLFFHNMLIHDSPLLIG